MPFLQISNADVSFGEKTLMWNSYTTIEALLTIKQVQINNPKELIIAVLDINSEIFMVYVAIWKQEEMPVYSKKEAQVGALLFDKAFTEVPTEYSDHNNVFSAENAAELPENIGINDHAIELEEDKQSSFGPIYSLELIKLEILKIYIKINLVNSFIWSSKSLARAFIFFN